MYLQGLMQRLSECKSFTDHKALLSAIEYSLAENPLKLSFIQLVINLTKNCSSFILILEMKGQKHFNSHLILIF